MSEHERNSEVLFIGSTDSVAHDPGARHPERPERWSSLRQAFDAQAWSEPAVAPREVLEWLHDPTYVETLFEVDKQLRGTTSRAKLDPDTAMNAGTLQAARKSVGGALQAVDVAVQSSRSDNVRDSSASGQVVPFAIGRPPGHHAEAGRAMGFCFFNSVALAAEYAHRQHGLQRVLIVDWDVHHGNGTQHLFESREDVLFISCHRGGGFYPGTGRVEERGNGPGRGFTVNLPLEPGTGDAIFVDLFQRAVAPIARDFRPELILVSAGFDAHELDPLGGLNVTGNGFGSACVELLQLADDLCEGRLAVVLEGGYDLNGLEDGVRSCVQAVTSKRDKNSTKETAPPTPAVSLLIDQHSDLWPGLRAQI